MLAHADGIAFEKGAAICGPSEVGPTNTTALPGVAKKHIKLLCEFEASNGFKTGIVKYIKIGFAGSVFHPLLFSIRACECSEPGSTCADLLGNP